MKKHNTPYLIRCGFEETHFPFMPARHFYLRLRRSSLLYLGLIHGFFSVALNTTNIGNSAMSIIIHISCYLLHSYGENIRAKKLGFLRFYLASCSIVVFAFTPRFCLISRTICGKETSAKSTKTITNATASLAHTFAVRTKILQIPKMKQIPFQIFGIIIVSKNFRR